MFAFAIVGGIAFLISNLVNVEYKHSYLNHKGVVSYTNMVVDAVLVTMAVMSGMLVLRLALFKGSSVILYDEVLYMLVWDALITTFIVKLCFCERSAEKGGDYTIRLIMVLCAAVAFLTVFVLQIKAWNNVNSGFYQAILPKRFIWITGIPVLISGILRLIHKKKYSYGKEGVMNSIISLICLWTTFCVCPFIETVLLNRSEFSIDFSGIVAHVFAGLIILLTLILPLPILLTNKKSRKLLSVVAIALTISGYIQGAFLNGHLFLMDGKQVDIEPSKIVINTIVWIVLILAIVIIMSLKKIEKYAETIVKYASLFLIAIQLIGLVGVAPKLINEKQEVKTIYDGNYLSDYGICEIGREENVIVFVLDTYDTEFLGQVLETNPDFLEPLNGFTRYTDVISQFSRTFPSIPYMLTHRLYFFDYPQRDYADKAYEECDFWKIIKDKGFNYYLYIIGDENIGQSVMEKAGNYSAKATVIKESFSVIGCAKSAIQVGGYRLLPLALKEYESYTAKTLEDMIIKERVWDKARYMDDDVYYFDLLKDNGLALSDEDKCFKYIHLEGAHAPYDMDSNGNKVTDRIVEPVEQYIGSMNYVYMYISELKRLGVFEDTMIIITADHGENFVTEELHEETNPILFIKPFGVGDDEPLKENNCRASLEDILTVISEETEIGYSDGVGINILHKDEESTKDRVRYHYYSVVKDQEQVGAIKYEITGDSNDFSNWKKTDEYHEYLYYH